MSMLSFLISIPVVILMLIGGARLSAQVYLQAKAHRLLQDTLVCHESGTAYCEPSARWMWLARFPSCPMQKIEFSESRDEIQASTEIQCFETLQLFSKPLLLVKVQAARGRI